MAITDQLSAWWELGEASGTRADSTGNGQTLTDNNTVTQAVGKVGNAAQFTAGNSETLSRASETLLQPGPDFTTCFWIYPNAYSNSKSFIGKYFDGVATFQWTVGDNGGGYTKITIWDSVVGSVNVTIDTPTSDNAWYFIMASYTSGDKKARISVNDGTVQVSSALTTGIATTATCTFELGGRVVESDYNSCRMDQVGYWKRVLTSLEVTQIYNGGAGVAYADIAPAVAPRPSLGAQLLGLS